VNHKPGDEDPPRYYDPEYVRALRAAAKLSDLERRCVQCFGEPDGKESLRVPKHGGAAVCWRFYRAD
jgi:hypothetical protein